MLLGDEENSFCSFSLWSELLSMTRYSAGVFGLLLVLAIAFADEDLVDTTSGKPSDVILREAHLR